MEVLQIQRDTLQYPTSLGHFLTKRAPNKLTAIGSVDLLTRKALAFFCSIKCPGSLILRTYDLAQQLRQEPVTLIGGFHSPVERECLTILLHSLNPIIICPARGLETMRVSREFKKPLEEGRLLLLSAFPKYQRRATSEISFYRNEVVAALAERVFVAYAEPLGKTEQFCRKILTRGKPLHTFKSESNANLIAMGAKPMNENHGFEMQS